MTRLIKVAANGPIPLNKADIVGDRVWLCGCGLSAKKPFCDGSHAKARTEGVDELLYYPGNDDANPPVAIDPAALEKEPAP